MKLKPETIIEIIKEEFNIDVTIKTRKRSHSDLRSIYFWASQKYCKYNSLTHIAEIVGRGHSNAIIMTERMTERLNVNGYEDLTEKAMLICEIIEERYKEDEGVIFSLRIQKYDKMKLQNELKRSRELNKKLLTSNKKITTLINAFEAINRKL